RSRSCNGPDMVNQVLAAHADARIAAGQRLVRHVWLELDFILVTVRDEVRIGQRFKAQLVQGIRGVGDQLPQKDFPLRIKGMDHEMKKLRSLSLELERVLSSCGRHSSLLIWYRLLAAGIFL